MSRYAPDATLSLLVTVDLTSNPEIALFSIHVYINSNDQPASISAPESAHAYMTHLGIRNLLLRRFLPFHLFRWREFICQNWTITFFIGVPLQKRCSLPKTIFGCSFYFLSTEHLPWLGMVKVVFDAGLQSRSEVNSLGVRFPSGAA
jgi:hypothetical protein